MSTESSPTDVHAAVFDLLPWWVNGTLEGAEAALVDHHLQACEACRREVATQQRLRDAIRDDVSKVEHAPQASFEKLWSRIEEMERDVPRTDADTSPPLTAPARASPPAAARWRLAAAILLVVGAASLGTVSWRSSRQDDAARYHTATSAERVDSAAPRIRAVFADTTTVEELATITRAAGLTVVAGPTEAGVYTLALQRNASAAAIDEAVVRLRDDPRVRFAEPVASREASQ
ncbi:MAG TPA: zf-HC2 domain-containing protein [Steroidobacteraceae bacterium]|nr:zf-HC2 domain-containing protein [Steroidobacteraceae bacterium]